MTKQQNAGQEEKPRTEWKAWLIQLAVGLLLVGVLLFFRDLPEDSADRLRAVDDTFTIVALLYLCIGSLLWVSTTGFFDIFGFSAKRALHAFIPGLVKDITGDYYEYREGRQLKRRTRSLKSTFFAGFVLLLISIVLTIWWSMIAG